MISTVLAVVSLLATTEQTPSQEPPRARSVALKERPVSIAGKIQGYKQVYRTGKLSWFDAVTRIPQERIFNIGLRGDFLIEFDLRHPVLGCARMDLEGTYHGLYLEPGQDYQVSIDGAHLTFLGDAGRSSNEFARYGAAVAKDLAAEQARASLIQTAEGSASDAREGYEAYAAARRAHLSSYAEAHSLSEATQRTVELDIQFEAAHSLICYRHELVNGRLKPRRSLRADYLTSLFERYPVNTSNAVVSRRYIDYVANIVQVLEAPADPSVEARIGFYRTQDVFTAEELALIAGAYGGDRSVLTSEAFATFDTAENQAKEFALRKRYRLNSILTQVKSVEAGLGRDLIVSQGVARQYFSGDFIPPTKAEWKAIEGMIQSEAILLALRQEASRAEGSLAGEDEDLTSSATGASTQAVDDLLAASKGKVIYIDFWATWCAPCRVEIPDAKRLTAEFAEDHVVFLNLCASSSETDWSRLVKQKNLGGEHLLLSAAAYRQLAKRYGVTGFPTYVLIDREGKVVRKSAPRPSSGEEIVSLIRSLLK